MNEGTLLWKSNLLDWCELLNIFKFQIHEDNDWSVVFITFNIIWINCLLVWLWKCLSISLQRILSRSPAAAPSFSLHHWVLGYVHHRCHHQRGVSPPQWLTRRDCCHDSGVRSPMMGRSRPAGGACCCQQWPRTSVSELLMVGAPSQQQWPGDQSIFCS